MSPGQRSNSVRLAAKQGKPIPEHWALDRDGVPTTDPQEALLHGFIQWTGGYKGFGLATVVEVLGGVLSGGLFGTDVPPMKTFGQEPLLSSACRSRRRRRSTGHQLRILMTTSIQSPASHPSHKNVATVPATESVVSNNRKTCWPSDNVGCLSATGLRKNSTAKSRNVLTSRLCPNACACKLVCD